MTPAVQPDVSHRPDAGSVARSRCRREPSRVAACSDADDAGVLPVHDLADVDIAGRRMRLVGTQTGIWKPERCRAALSIVTGYYPDPTMCPYADEMGPDNLLRYKLGTECVPCGQSMASRRDGATSAAGVVRRSRPSAGWTNAALPPVFPVWLIAEEPERHQFVVGLDAAERTLIEQGRPHANEIERRYNLATVRQRLHQPIFRPESCTHTSIDVPSACLPFDELLDAAHIKSDSEGGRAAVSNGLALCRIHHGAFDADILGISPDYQVTIRSSVLDTFDGPTLQHALEGDARVDTRVAAGSSSRTARP